MFFLIPIGSEEGVRRLPYLTIGLIVLNSIIWFITSMVLGGQINELEKINEELFDIESKYMYRIIETDPTLLTKCNIDEIRERFIADEIIPRDSEDYEEWMNLYKEFTTKRSNMVFERWGFTPKKFEFLKIFSSMFIHANFLHLLFNMLFLWLVGCNIEDDWSWKVFLGLYLISGVIACLLHTAFFPKSTVPLIGASGAIAGIMGAFMIRHYKTKIRFAYFLWFILIRPYYGTFAIYAGIALPFWFLQQIIFASGGAESGTAHWAHVGGFVFGAVVGISMKIFGIEKKYVAPMVEDSFEKLKMSPKMKEVNKKLDTGDTTGAIPLLLMVINEEPQNFDALLMLARIYFEKGLRDDAIVMYKKAFDLILRIEDSNLILSTYEEIREKEILNNMPEKNIYNLASFLEKAAKYEEAARLFGLYIQLYPGGKVRPKAIYRAHLLFKDKLNNKTMAQHALAFLKKEYPDWLQLQ